MVSCKFTACSKNPTALAVLECQWDFEDEYSHNEIDEAQMHFVKIANRYFKENKIGFIAFFGCECVLIKVLEDGSEYDSYE